jgi:hypothetical protein
VYQNPYRLATRLRWFNLLAGLGLLAIVSPAWAVDAELFSPILDSKGLFTLHSSHLVEPGYISTGLEFSYAKGSLAVDLGDDTRNAVANLGSGHLLLGVGVLEEIEIEMNLPFRTSQGDGLPQPEESSITATGVGDVMLLLKGNFLNAEHGSFGLGFVAFTTFATGDESVFLGSGAMTIGAKIVLDKHFGALTPILNLGWRYLGSESIPLTDSAGNQIRDEENNIIRTSLTLSPSNEVNYGLGAEYLLVKESASLFGADLSLMGELAGRSINFGFDQLYQDQVNAEIAYNSSVRNPYIALREQSWESPLEARLGVKMNHKNLALNLGGGFGLLSGVSSPLYRVFIGIQYGFSTMTPASAEEDGGDGEGDGNDDGEEDDDNGSEAGNTDQPANPVGNDNEGDDDDDNDDDSAAKTPVSPVKPPQTTIVANPYGDDDKDGISNGDEVEKYQTDPVKVDSDADEISDYDEVFSYSSNPINADSDGDGLNDRDELYTYHTVMKNADTDGDGLSDGDEVFKYKTDPKNPDSDGDGLWDKLEIDKHKTNPNLKDSDGDKLPDADEVEVYFTDPNNKDSDGDGLSDYDEIFKYKTDPFGPDTDGDGILDGKDKHPLVPEKTK